MVARLAARTDAAVAGTSPAEILGTT